MARSFNDEKPPARINIKIKPAEDAQDEVELAFRMLALGNYKGREDEDPVEDRKPVKIDDRNFNGVMNDMKPRVVLNDVANRLTGSGDMPPITLEFTNIKDFRPEAVVQKVEPLKQLLAMRNLLVELRNGVLGRQAFRKALNEIIKDEAGRAALIAELDRVVQLGSSDD